MQDKSKIVDKVKKLLALSASPNQSEAGAAMRKAYKLMIDHNISTADVVEKKYNEKEIQTKYKRLPKHYAFIVFILQNYFNVRILFISGSKYKKARVFFTGTNDNLDVAIYVYHYLILCFERLYKVHKKNVPYAHKISYMTGVYMGLDMALEAQKKTVLADIDDSRALMIINDTQLDKFVSDNNPNIKTCEVRNKKLSVHDVTQGLSDGKNIQIKPAIK